MELDHHALGHLDYFQLRAIKNSDEYSVESTLQIGVPGQSGKYSINFSG